MAKARALDRRRRSIRNIRKITRTMELIATARFKKAMDRATAATAYTRRITQIVNDLSQSGLEVSHPLLDERETTRCATLMVITSNRGLCGGYNSSIVRAALARHEELKAKFESVRLELSGKRGISMFKFRKLAPHHAYTHFGDQPRYQDVDVVATRLLEEYATGQIDRLDVAYMRFVSASKQVPEVETLLPLGSLELGPSTGGPSTGGASPVGASPGSAAARESDSARRGESIYDLLPSAESILAEVVPASFKARLFKCFLDAAVSEQISRMVAMKSATENAGDIIRRLSMAYNRARQSQITGEIMEVLGGVEALKG
jgi:F-type H+-transporting ATPase subunit gamma